jgi:apolipoprotein N-acyltransferase
MGKIPGARGGTSSWPAVGTAEGWVDLVVSTLSRRERRASSGHHRRWRLPSVALLLRCGIAIGSGLLLYAATPPSRLWWLAPLSIAPWLGLLRGRRARAGFGYGIVFGLAYLLPLLGWLLAFLGAQFGPWPWIGVALVESVFFGLAGAGVARVSKLPAAPVWTAAVFVAAELLKTTIPFGGFPWGRLAFTQGGGLLLPLASIGGSALVTFAVALIGAALAELGRRAVLELPAWRGLITPLVLVLVPLVGGIAAQPLVGTDPNAGTARVGVVQGNAPNLGLGLLNDQNALYDNTINGAMRLADQVRAGRAARPSFVVLPEEVGSWGPTRTDPTLSFVALRLGVPLIVGGLTQDADGQLRNKVLRWDPVLGDTGEYTKQHLVPFAETIPMRSVAKLVTPFVNLFPQNMIPGNQPGVFQVGNARVGVGECYDVAYDNVFTSDTRAGATVLAVPTNNAWYGYSNMSYQQLAMAQMTAVENGRAVVVSATSGVSAVVQPNGTVTRQTPLFTARSFVATVPLRATRTLASRLGGIPSWTLAAAGVAAVAFTLRRRRI